MASAGIFQLYEKYYTLSKLDFEYPDPSMKPPEEEKIATQDKNTKVLTGKIIEELKKKNQNLQLYTGFLLITLTKNLKILYSNLDSLLLIDQKDVKQLSAPMTVYEKIYGQQSFLLCSKMIINDSKISKYLQCLGDFKL